MSYHGGKNGSGVYQKIISLIPYGMKTFIELFAGSAAISRNIKRPDKIILIELNQRQLAEIELPHDQRIERLNVDAFDFLRDPNYADIIMNESTVLYVDAPYPRSTRRDKKRPAYQFELWDEREAESGIHTHLELLELLRPIRCKVMVSCYPNELYDEQLVGWNTFQFTTTDRGHNKRVEKIWYNFDTPKRLYDHRFLGKNDRERWRINKRRRRLVSRFLALPAQERWALFETLEEALTNHKEISDEPVAFKS